MDALERVMKIGQSKAVENWPRDRFLHVAAQGKKRWIEAEKSLGVQYSMFQDAVAVVAPDFQLSSEEEAAALSVEVPRRRNVTSRIAVWFAKWERCPKTSGLPNPYEPWIEIWEHGGAFGVEHGLFVDVEDSEHMPVGAVIARRA